jgi:hypothetical protein
MGVVFAALLMLNLAPREAECPEHASHDVATAPVAPPGDGEAQVALHDHDASETEAPCDKTDRRDCCKAMESCSNAHALRTPAPSESAPIAYAPVSVFGARAPSYLIPAPEPPPPKA